MWMCVHMCVYAMLVGRWISNDENDIRQRCEYMQVKYYNICMDRCLSFSKKQLSMLYLKHNPPYENHDYFIMIYSLYPFVLLKIHICLTHSCTKICIYKIIRGIFIFGVYKEWKTTTVERYTISSGIRGLLN